MTKVTLKRLLFLALLVTVAHASTSQAEEILYDCCGNEKSVLDNECRYTNRNSTCTYGADCNGDTYGACCIQGCYKIFENE